MDIHFNVCKLTFQGKATNTYFGNQSTNIVSTSRLANDVCVKGHLANRTIYQQIEFKLYYAEKEGNGSFVE